MLDKRSKMSLEAVRCVPDKQTLYPLPSTGSTQEDRKSS